MELHSTARLRKARAIMSPVEVLLLALLIGLVTGLRSFTGVACVAWGAHRGWLKLQGTPLAFMGSTVAVAVFFLAAAAEYVLDQLPSTPPRTHARGLTARAVMGGLSGACVAAAGAQSLTLGAVLGVAGGVAGAFGGYEVRTRLVKALGVPDFVIACLEDLVAIGGGLLFVSRL